MGYHSKLQFTIDENKNRVINLLDKMIETGLEEVQKGLYNWPNEPSNGEILKHVKQIITKPNKIETILT